MPKKDKITKDTKLIVLVMVLVALIGISPKIYTRLTEKKLSTEKYIGEQKSINKFEGAYINDLKTAFKNLDKKLLENIYSGEALTFNTQFIDSLKKNNVYRTILYKRRNFNIEEIYKHKNALFAIIKVTAIKKDCYYRLENNKCLKCSDIQVEEQQILKKAKSHWKIDSNSTIYFNRNNKVCQ